VQCPVGVSASGIVIEARVCGGDSVGIVMAVLWQIQCDMARSRSNGEDIMVVRCPVRRLSIVHHERSCLLEPWATIQRGRSTGDREYHAMAWGGRVEGAIENHVTRVRSPGQSRSFGYLTPVLNSKREHIFSMWSFFPLLMLCSQDQTCTIDGPES